MSDHLHILLEKLHDKTIKGGLNGWATYGTGVFRIYEAGYIIDLSKQSDQRYNFSVLNGSSVLVQATEYVSGNNHFHKAKELYDHIEDRLLNKNAAIEQIIKSLDQK